MITLRTLQQILDVLYLLRVYIQSGKDLVKSYQKAVNRVSAKYDVTYQAIGDSCRRRLDLESIEKFRELAESWIDGKSQKLESLLKEKTSTSYHQKIQKFFNDPSRWNYEIEGNKFLRDNSEKETLEIKLSEQELRYLKALSEIEKIEVNDYLRIFVKEGIKSRLNKIAGDLQ